MTDNFNYLEERLEEQRKWHSSKATMNKKRYYTTEIITLTTGSLIPVINVLNFPGPVRLISALLAATGVISAGIAKLCKYQENWLNFRAVAEALKREKELYEHQIGDYELDSGKRQKLLVERVEEILASTTAKFISIQKKKQDKPAGQ